MLLETLEYLGIAFICSVILIIMSKIILQALIRRPADYYNARELREEELMLNAGGISITKEHETNPEGEIIEEKHLEAQLGDIEAAEPEEIMLEVPDAIAESIEVHKEQEDEVAETVSEPEKETEEAAEPEKEAEEVTEETEPEPEVAEETEAEPEPEPEVPEETEPEPEPEPAVEEPEAEPEEPKTPEETFGFSIKAKTSRTKKPKRKEEEEAAEELEEAKAAMDEAKARAAESEPVSEWTESYAEIRDSLEKAFTERRRKPSMHMNKKELTEIAIGMGIELPDKVTKREILDLINEAAEEQAADSEL
jgi:outer membrane biosynthesis protein TonB